MDDWLQKKRRRTERLLGWRPAVEKAPPATVTEVTRDAERRGRGGENRERKVSHLSLTFFLLEINQDFEH